MSKEKGCLSCYTLLLTVHVKAGYDPTDAAVMTVEDYLAGKPRQSGSRKVTQSERDAAFWSSEFLGTLPVDVWHTEPLILALARYFSQERVSNINLLEHIAVLAPDAVRRAIRYSGLVLRQQSARRLEINHLAVILPTEFGELVRILDVFNRAYHERLAAVDRLRQPLARLSPLDLLSYASLYAFEHLVPQVFPSAGVPAVDPDTRTDRVWDAINDVLIWKLGTVGDTARQLTERDIAESLRLHLSPFLFPSGDGQKPQEDLYEAFGQLLAVQIELNSFITRSANAFSYNDSIDFVLKDDQLAIVEHDPARHAAWARNDEKLARLHGYWFYRAEETFLASDMATAIIGRPENHEANRFAYIKALRTQLQLTEVYGVSDTVTAESGLQADLFQVLLSLELMTAFFNLHFIVPYLHYLGVLGDSQAALGKLAFDGLLQPNFQNRFPITWSDRAAKITNIKGWTVSNTFPQGNLKAAEAILDFWTSDWGALATRLHKQEPGLHPALFERPILKMGRHLFQLPWVVAIQNNATAAINNLRRLGSRRTEARNETRRIEERLAQCFASRGVRVRLNYKPKRTAYDDPGEVDLICAQDRQILVLEIKSTFLRRSPKDAWLHGTTTLRKAGLQLRRKVHAVARDLTVDTGLADTLGIKPDDTLLPLRGWIVDTSIEHDHEQFSGFLKVALEEVLIALHDDRHLLNVPGEWLNDAGVNAHPGALVKPNPLPTLYPDEFSLSRFIEVIETERVWMICSLSAVL